MLEVMMKKKRVGGVPTSSFSERGGRSFLSCLLSSSSFVMGGCPGGVTLVTMSCIVCCSQIQAWSRSDHATDRM